MKADSLERDVAGPASGSVGGVRLFTRGQVTLPWLSTTVIPAARAARDNGDGVVWLRRGWLHGPHVDIIGRGVPGQGPLWESIAAGLDAGPSPAVTLDEELYLAQAREFGRLESVPPPYLPMREHGAVEFLGQDEVGPRATPLRELREVEVVNSVLCPPLMNLIDELTRSPALATVRLAEAFAALGDSYFLGLSYGAFSFRSHVEAFLAKAASSKDMRPAFADRLAIESAEIETVVRQRLSGAVSPAAAQWRTAFAYCTGALDSAVVDGRLTAPMLDSINAAAAGRPGGAPGWPETAFHEAVADTGVVDDPPPWFASYRLLINLFYEQLPLLTVSPLQRYYMCYAIAEAVDRVLGQTWEERLSAGQAKWRRVKENSR